jgi:prepilin-type N-terminal cleavage/methylation domain-containing protein
MMPTQTPVPRQRGFSVIELMISVAISLIILAGLSAMLVNVSRTNSEMAKSNSQIENGRFAVEALESDLVHAGFWGEYVPQFDDLSWMFKQSDAPATAPDPCLAYSSTNWDRDYLNGLLGIPVQTSDGVLGTCTLPDRVAGTDALLVRHAETCVPGNVNCEADVSGKLYFQSALCAAGTWGAVVTTGTDATHVALAPPSASANTAAIADAYKGMTIRITEGTGSGQTRTVTAFDPITYVATVSSAWATIPDGTSKYTIFDGVLSTSSFPLRQRSCLATAPTAKRKFVSNIYYVRSYASTAGDGIPTLVRSSFDLGSDGTLAHQAPEALVEGIENFAVELGIDNVVTRCGFNSAVDYSTIADLWNSTTCLKDSVPENNSLPKNRGDGSADTFIRCTTAAPCGADKLRDAVSARLFLLVRNTEATPGYADAKTYCLATIPVGGTCPSTSTYAAPSGTAGYKRHLFSTTIRLTAISARRESK